MENPWKVFSIIIIQSKGLTSYSLDSGWVASLYTKWLNNRADCHASFSLRCFKNNDFHFKNGMREVINVMDSYKKVLISHSDMLAWLPGKVSLKLTGEERGPFRLFLQVLWWDYCHKIYDACLNQGVLLRLTGRRGEPRKTQQPQQS